jgi:hypothetical protein
MKQFSCLIVITIMLFPLCLGKAAAQSSDETQIINLPGNTRVIVNPSTPTYVFKDRFDDRDIVRFMINPQDGWRSVYVTKGDAQRGCLGHERRRDQRQCLRDLKKQQEALENRR